jgi:hypothetical protein
MALTVGAIDDFELPPERPRDACVSEVGSANVGMGGSDEFDVGAGVAAAAVEGGAGTELEEAGAGGGAAGALAAGGGLAAAAEWARVGCVADATWAGDVGATAAGGEADLWDVTHRFAEHPGTTSANPRAHKTARSCIRHPYFLGPHFTLRRSCGLCKTPLARGERAS